MGRKFIQFIILNLIIISSIAFAQQVQHEQIAYLGDQVDPHVDGRYIVYLKDTGKGKFDIIVHDAGKTLDPVDDFGEIQITKDGSQHKYSNPVIDRRYIAWLDNNKDVYVYDMGEDEQINVGQDIGIKKLDINDKVNDADTLKQRDYTKKDNLALSKGTLVWDDFDNLHGDKDVRGYVVEKSEFNIEGLFIVSDDKIVTFGVNDYPVNEFDPYILGDDIVFAKDEYTDLGDFGVKEESEIFLGRFEKVCRLDIPQDFNCISHDTSVELSEIALKSLAKWKAIAKIHNINFIDKEGELAKERDYYVLFSPSRPDKIRIVEVTQMPEGSLTTSSKVVLRDVETRETVADATVGTSGQAQLTIDGETFYIKVNIVNGNAAGFSITWGAGASAGNVGDRIDKFQCELPASVPPEICEAHLIVSVVNTFSSRDDGCSASEPSINKENVNGVVWVESCAGIYQIVINRQRIVQDQGGQGLKYHSPLIKGDYVYYVEESTANGLLLKSSLRAGLLRDGLSVATPNIDLDNYRLVFTEKGNDIDVGAIRVYASPSLLLLYSIATVSDKNGGVITAWQSSTQDNSISKVYAQSLSSTGVFNPNIPSKISDNGVLVSAISDNQDGALIGLSTLNPRERSILVQGFKSDGSLRFPDPVKIVDNVLSTSSYYLHFIEYGLGGVIIEWSSALSPQGTFVQFFHPDGTLTPKNPIELDKFAYNNIPIISDTKGGAIIGRSIYDPVKRSFSINVQFLKSDGTFNPLDPIKITDNGYIDSFVSDKNGGAIISWINYDQTIKKIKTLVKFLDANGNVKPADPIEFDDLNKSIIVPANTLGDITSAILVGIKEDVIAKTSTINAQFISSDGTKKNPIKVFETAIPNGILNLNSISDGQGGAIISWQIPNDLSYYIQILDSNGNLRFNNPVKIDVTNNNFLTQIIADEKGGAIISYISDQRDAIITEFLDSNGNLKKFTIPGLIEKVTFHNAEPKQPPKFQFTRGDSDGNKIIDLTDAITILNYLFAGQKAPTCLDSADANDDGQVDLSDAVTLLQYMFLGGTPPAAPFLDAGNLIQGEDATQDNLDCKCYGATC